MAKSKMPTIGEMRDRVIICTTVERPDRNVSTLVNRPGVFEASAKIRQAKPWQVLNWASVAINTHALKSASEVTALIWIRMPPDVKVDLNHWVYQLTGYAKNWYRVVSTEDVENQGRFLLLYCALDQTNDERSDPATQESPPRWEEPDFPLTINQDRI